MFDELVVFGLVSRQGCPVASSIRTASAMMRLKNCGDDE
jgi:hypothetical protein